MDTFLDPLREETVPDSPPPHASLSGYTSAKEYASEHDDDDALPDPFLAEEDIAVTEPQNPPLVAPQPVVPVSTLAIEIPAESLNLNKEGPPPSPPPVPSKLSEYDESDEDDAPDVDLSELVSAHMFLPIPNVREFICTCLHILRIIFKTDPVNTLLTKYIYPPEARPMRDLSGEWEHNNFHALVVSSFFLLILKTNCPKDDQQLEVLSENGQRPPR